MTYSPWKFPHETLDVYQDAREFLRLVHSLHWPRGLGELKQQIQRAALSVVLNICEGRSQRLAGNSGSNFYRIALGSAAECHGALEALEIIRDQELEAEAELVRRIGARMAGLIKACR